MHPESTSDHTSQSDLGRRLRLLRLENGFSQERLAREAGLSKSFISQLERGRSAVSFGRLKRICSVLGVPAWAVLDGVEESGAAASSVVVRRGERRTRRIVGSGIDLSLLTPDLRRRLQVTMSVIGPGEGYGRESYTHDGEEFGLVLEGTYEVVVGDTVHVLEAGDSIYFSSTVPHRTRTLGDAPVVTLWAVTPPS